MLNPKKKALEITTELVKAKLSSSTVSPSETGGKAVADFFQVIYDKVSEITESIAESDENR